MSEPIPIRVLLVEDDEDVLVSTAQALKLAGFAVESFVSAERARAHIAFDAPVVVVCDVRLPRLRGTDWLPEGLEDVTGYPRLLAALADRGWSDADLAGLTCRNVLRAMGDAGLTGNPEE